MSGRLPKPTKLPKAPSGGVRLVPFRSRHLAGLMLAPLLPLPAGWALEAAGVGWSLLDDAGTVACGGVAPLHPGVGQAWAFVSGRHGRAVARAARGLLPAAVRRLGLRRLQATVRWDDDRALRFALWLGLQPEGRMRGYGLDGQDHMLLAILPPGGGRMGDAGG